MTSSTRKSGSGSSSLSVTARLKYKRERTEAFQAVEPDKPVPVLIPVSDGWLVSSTAAPAVIAMPRKMPTNCLTWARSFSFPP